MHDNLRSRVAESLLRARHVLVVGANSLPPLQDEARVIRLRGAGTETVGVLDEARVAIAVALGDAPERGLPRRPATRLRRRILGEHWAPAEPDAFVAACNQLRDRLAGSALVIEEAGALGPASVQALAAVLGSPDSLELPLVLCFEREIPEALGAAFDALISEGRADRHEVEQPATFDPLRLKAPELRVLRAAAVLGAEVETDHLAELLEASTLEVVEHLQRAADQGAPIADRGDGRFGIPSAMIETLREGTLPSLSQIWHRRAAAILAPPTKPEPLTAPLPMSEPPSFPEVFEPKPTRTAPGEVDRAEGIAAPSKETDAEPRVAGPVHVDLERAAPPSEAARKGAPREHPHPDHARAAHHLEAAGARPDAVSALLGAAEQTLSRGDAARALSLVERAHSLAAQLPQGAERDELEGRCALQKGVILWCGASVGGDYSLDTALEVLDGARGRLRKTADPQVRADLAHAIAGVCFERGDLRSLERALIELTETTRQLTVEGHPRQAARLLNDQAAVYLRAGDPVRAVHLLRNSREVFRQLTTEDPTDRLAATELAETEHLLARLPLHGNIQAGREMEAYAAGIDHARTAGALYRHLEDGHELARVWETVGRLELAQGRPPEAVKWLAAALETQEKLGDVLGVARTTAALADVLAGAGRLDDALAMLRDSVAANASKGSAIGLAYNVRALEALDPALLDEPQRRVAAALRHKVLELSEQLGDASLPPLA